MAEVAFAYCLPVYQTFVKGSLLSLCNYVSERKVIFRLTDLENSWGECWGEGMVREFGMDMYTLRYLKWITNKDLLCSMYMYGWVPSLFTGNCHNIVTRFYLDVSACKESASNTGHKQEMWVWSLGQEDPMEEKMASILAWKIPWTEKPDRLYSP